MTRTLFDLDLPAHQRHSATSRAAAVAIAPHAETLRAWVLREIQSCGFEGCTDQECQELMCIDPGTQRARRVELVQAGLVRDSGRTRATRAGRKATVWIAVNG